MLKHFFADCEGNAVIFLKYSERKLMTKNPKEVENARNKKISYRHITQGVKSIIVIVNFTRLQLLLQ